MLGREQLATSIKGRRLRRRAARCQLIELIYLVVANELECAECGHLLGRGLRVRDTAIGPPPSWPVKVDTRCWGWRRHRHAAEVTRPSKDLMLGDLELTAR